ncbi:MAG TPA: hypothetical protein VF472_07245 [Burkholderiaceae bacterium]
MEVALIFICAWLAYMQFFPAQHAELLRTAAVSPVNLLKYLGASAILFLVLSILPVLALNIYMRHYDFFAYEVFDREVFPIQIIGLNIFLNFAIMALVFFCAGIIWKSADRSRKIFSIVTSASVVLLFVLLALSSGRYGFALAIFVFSLIIGSYFIWWTRNGFQDKARWWFVPSVYAVILIGLPILFSPATVWIVEYSLAEMKVGYIDAELFDLSKPCVPGDCNSLKGKLLLRTPEFYYLLPAEDNDSAANKQSPHVGYRSVMIVNQEHMGIKYLAKIPSK